jgi:uncharacterized Zn-finger protein
MHSFVILQLNLSKPWTDPSEKVVLTGFCCYICGMQTSTTGNLTVHMRRHTGERPYKCSTCNATFAHSNALKVHCRIHTGEKPYSCHICGEKFAALRTCKTHYIKSHLFPNSQWNLSTSIQDVGPTQPSLMFSGHTKFWTCRGWHYFCIMDMVPRLKQSLCFLLHKNTY